MQTDKWVVPKTCSGSSSKLSMVFKYRINRLIKSKPLNNDKNQREDKEI